jgi:hypothetical protein
MKNSTRPVRIGHRSTLARHVVLLPAIALTEEQRVTVEVMVVECATTASEAEVVRSKQQ